MGKKPTKPKGTVAMKAAAPARPELSEEQLPGRARRALRDRDVALSGLRAFDIETLAFLERRAGTSVTPLEEGPGAVLFDGHRPSVRYGAGGHSSGTGDGQANAVVSALDSGYGTVDIVVPAEVTRCYEDLAEAARSARRAASRLARLQKNPQAVLGDDERRCQCCLWVVSGVGEDRLKAGFGPACYAAWVRAGRPDRVAFVARRRAELDERREAS